MPKLHSNATHAPVTCNRNGTGQKAGNERARGIHRAYVCVGVSKYSLLIYGKTSNSCSFHFHPNGALDFSPSRGANFSFPSRWNNSPAGNFDGNGLDADWTRPIHRALSRALTMSIAIRLNIWNGRALGRSRRSLASNHGKQNVRADAKLLASFILFYNYLYPAAARLLNRSMISERSPHSPLTSIVVDSRNLGSLCCPRTARSASFQWAVTTRDLYDYQPSAWKYLKISIIWYLRCEKLMGQERHHLESDFGLIDKSHQSCCANLFSIF